MPKVQMTPIEEAPLILDGTHTERAEVAGVFRLIQHMKPIAYNDEGTLRRIDTSWADGDETRPNIVMGAGFAARLTVDGARRIYPRVNGRLSADRYFKIGAPLYYSDGWKSPDLGAPVRSGNTLTWDKPAASLIVRHGGHFIDQDIMLKAKAFRPTQWALPVDLSGMTRRGGTFYVDDVPVMQLRPFVLKDAANEEFSRAIPWELAQQGEQWYIVLAPDYAGCASPVIDPTLTLQPDATDGQDTFLRASTPVTNFGSYDYVIVGERNDTAAVHRTLIKFALTGLPTAAVISAATLSLSASADFADNARTFRVYRLKRAWVETQATWNIYSTGNSWDTAGGFGANDSEQTDIGSRAFTATETLDVFKNFSLMPSTKAGLDLGNGWLVKADTEADDAYAFRSSDYTTAEYRPKLVVIYTLPPGNMVRAPMWGRY